MYYITEVDPSDSPNAAILAGPTLLLHAHRILDTVLSVLVPAVPSTTRLDAVTVCAHVLHVVKEDSGRGKLRSFAYHTGNSGGDSSADVDSVYSVLAYKVSVNKALVQLLASLDDSEDSVRVQCLECFRNTASLILSTADTNTLVTDRTSTTAVAQYTNLINTVRDNVCVLTDYAAIVKALLHRVPVVNVSENEEFVVYLDATLRALCVLDPVVFEQLVRTELAPRLEVSVDDSTDGVSVGSASVGGSKFTFDHLNQFVSGLLNHVDILQQFQG